METIPLFPLSAGLFPDGRLDLQIFEVRYLDLVRRCHREQTPFGVAWIEQGQEVTVPGQQPTLHSYGTVAHIDSLETVQAALLRIRCHGGQRFALHRTHAGPLGVWHGEVEYLAPDAAVDIPPDLEYLAQRLGRGIAQAQADGRLPELPLLAPFRLDECGWVANRWAELLPLPAIYKQALLQESDPLTRLRAIDRSMDREDKG
jgi:Lon protease-like protein